MYVSFRANIDFKDTPFEANFLTIRFGQNISNDANYDFVDIEGNNFEVRNFKQMGNSVNIRGLFANIDGTIKDLSIVNCDTWITANNITSGVLCSSIRGVLIENVHISGTHTTNGETAGMAYSLWARDNGGSPGTLVIRNCSVKLRVLNKANGFNGFCFQTNRGSLSASHQYEFTKCISSCTIINVVASENLGGFIGNSTGIIRISDCISTCVFISRTSARQFTGIVAGFRSTTNSLGTGGSINLRNCISRCRFEGQPPSTSANMSVFAPAQLTTSNTVMCYSISRFDLAGSTANIRGGDNVALFDHQVSGLGIGRFTDGVTYGVASDDLKSKEFLIGRGWTFT